VNNEINKRTQKKKKKSVKYMKGILLLDELQNYADLFYYSCWMGRKLIVPHGQMNGSLLTRHHPLSQVSYPDKIQNDIKLLDKS